MTTFICKYCNREVETIYSWQKVCKDPECQEKQRLDANEKSRAFRYKEYWQDPKADMEKLRKWKEANPEKWKAIYERAYKRPCLGGCGKLAMRENRSVSKGVYGKGYCKQCYGIIRRKVPDARECIVCHNIFVPNWIVSRSSVRKNRKICDTCIAAQHGSITLEKAGEMLGVTRERVRQLCVNWEVREGLTRQEDLEKVISGQRAPYQYRQSRN